MARRLDWARLLKNLFHIEQTKQNSVAVPKHENGNPRRTIFLEVRNGHWVKLELRTERHRSRIAFWGPQVQIVMRAATPLVRKEVP